MYRLVERANNKTAGVPSGMPILRNANAKSTRLFFNAPLAVIPGAAVDTKSMKYPESLKRLSQVVYTNTAICRDCFRCVRVCPVKAIRMSDGQASVVDDRCIACGTCVRECPQEAKSYRNDLETAIQLIHSGEKVACSLAPSFAGFFPSWQRKRIPSVLRRLGFSYVGETAVGAYFVAQATALYVKKHRKEPSICTSCPGVVEYVQKYQPVWARYLVPVVSPMVAHAAHIRNKMGSDVRVIFIGPCIAKKSEGVKFTGDGQIDCVLTFEEFAQWIKRENIEVSGHEESDFDEKPRGQSRLFPLEGGCVLTSGWSRHLLDSDVVLVSGFEGIAKAITESRPGQVIEPLFCPTGCAGGPGTNHLLDSPVGSYEARASILEYSKESNTSPQKTDTKDDVLTEDDLAFIDSLTVQYDLAKSPIVKKEISENAIRQFLEKTGKLTEAHMLNCGGCGYSTCREKAIASIEGLAEVEMCIPYVKRLAEQRVDKIIETSPNGIVVLDEQLNILHMNPAFRSFFKCSGAVCGKPISYLMDPEPFEKLTASQSNELMNIVVEHPNYSLVCHEYLYALPEEKQYIGIFTNITGLRVSQTNLDNLRERTVTQARELLEQQIQMAETIAITLGENAARAEALLENLMEQAKAET